MVIAIATYLVIVLNFESTTIKNWIENKKIKMKRGFSRFLKVILCTLTVRASRIPIDDENENKLIFNSLLIQTHIIHALKRRCQFRLVVCYWLKISNYCLEWGCSLIYRLFPNRKMRVTTEPMSVNKLITPFIDLISILLQSNAHLIEFQNISTETKYNCSSVSSNRNPVASKILWILVPNILYSNRSVLSESILIVSTK